MLMALRHVSSQKGYFYVDLDIWKRPTTKAAEGLTDDTMIISAKYSGSSIRE